MPGTDDLLRPQKPEWQIQAHADLVSGFIEKRMQAMHERREIPWKKAPAAT
jgi:hypothetical protein